VISAVAADGWVHVLVSSCVIAVWVALAPSDAPGIWVNKLFTGPVTDHASRFTSRRDGRPADHDGSSLRRSLR